MLTDKKCIVNDRRALNYLPLKSKEKQYLFPFTEPRNSKTNLISRRSHKARNSHNEFLHVDISSFRNKFREKKRITTQV